jgi:hypothetical protein
VTTDDVFLDHWRLAVRVLIHRRNNDAVLAQRVAEHITDAGLYVACLYIMTDILAMELDRAGTSAVGILETLRDNPPKQ